MQWHHEYSRLAGFGAKGFVLTKEEDIKKTLLAAKKAAREGHPAYINVHIGTSDFRKGSISV